MTDLTAQPATDTAALAAEPFTPEPVPFAQTPATAAAPNAEPAAPAPKPVAGEEAVETAMRSITGFDEIAIEQAFGSSFSDLSPTMTTRSVIFVLERRRGSTDAQAYQTAMRLGLGQVDDYPFAASGDDPGKAPASN